MKSLNIFARVGAGVMTFFTAVAPVAGPVAKLVDHIAKPTAITAGVLAAISCKPDQGEPEEQPKYRTQDIALDFGMGDIRTVKVEGTLLSADWNGAAGNIETALNEIISEAFSEWDMDVLANFGNVFKDNDTVITLKKNPGYKYKPVNIIDGIARGLEVDVDKITTIDFKEAVEKMANGNTNAVN
jgi:hypothetical protein